MFGISLTELLVIIFVAIFIVKPQDLPEIARQAGKLYSKIKRIIKKIKEEFEENKKDLGFDKIKQEFDAAVSQEEINAKENSDEIVDIYGNVHKVSNLKEIRSDLTKEELEEEIKRYNQLNNGEKP